MAPEVMNAHSEKSDKAYTTKADVWSLGVFAYELSEGDTPHRGVESIGQIFQRIHDNEAPKISDGRSPEFRDFVQKCLDKNDKTRWPA